MYKLAIAIPNYNRIGELKKLLLELISQIEYDSFQHRIEICVSDDCSEEDPGELIQKLRQDFPDVRLTYGRNSQNKGMDENFLNAVMLSDAEYCWLIGNDDLPETGGLRTVMGFLDSHEDSDFILTPFDTFSSNGDYINSTCPIKPDEDLRFDTSEIEECNRLILSVNHNSGIFGFLSNVIFRKSIWSDRKDKYQEKLGSIFIQMYINIDKLLMGSIFYYWNTRIIRNFADEEVNQSPDRISRILLGLDDVVEFFFENEEKKHLKRVLTDAYISGLVWNIETDSPYRKRIEAVVSEKNVIYKKYFIPRKDIKRVIGNRTVMIFGAGAYGIEALKLLDKDRVCVDGICDSDPDKEGMVIGRFVIMHIDTAVEEARQNKSCFVVANHHNLVPMVNKLEECGIRDIAVIT